MRVEADFAIIANKSSHLTFHFYANKGCVLAEKTCVGDRVKRKERKIIYFMIERCLIACGNNELETKQTCISLVRLCNCDLIRFTLDIGGWGKC